MQTLFTTQKVTKVVQITLVFAALLVTFTTAQAQRVTNRLVALYDFTEGSGTTVSDKTNNGLDLTIGDINDVNWLSGGGLKITGNTIIKSANNANDLIDDFQDYNDITIEAWVKPANNTQSGPARIVTLSPNTSERNFTLGQKGDDYAVRVRTSNTNQQGTPELETNGGRVSTSSIQHIVYTKNSSGTERFYVDGVRVEDERRSGSFNNWENFRLAIGNELTNNRSWKGSIYLVALYNKDLSASQVNQNFDEGYNTSSDESLTCNNNLVVNPGFEDVMNGWNQSGSAWVSWTENQAYSGTKSFIVNGFGDRGSTDKMNIDPNTNYSLSAYLKDMASSGHSTLGIEWLGNRNNLISEDSIVLNVDNIDEYTQVNFIAKSPSNARKAIVWLYNETRDHMYIDDVCLSTTTSEVPSTNNNNNNCTVTVRARGNCGGEQLNLLVNNQNVKTFTLTNSLANYTYDGIEDGDNVAVNFSTDGNNGCDRNIEVDYIEIDGTTYQSEDATLGESHCNTNPEWLWCNGSILYGSVSCSSSGSGSVSDVFFDDQWYFECGDNKKVDNYGYNANCRSTSTVTIPNSENVFQYAVEIVYKGSNPGNTITVQDAEGNNHILDRTQVTGSLSSYRVKVPGSTSSITYANNNRACNLQSIEVYAFRNDANAGTNAGLFINEHGHNNVVTFDIPIQTISETRDVSVTFPISEMTTDGRYIMVVAEAGGVSQTQFIYGPDTDIPGGNCCFNIVEFTLPNVPGAADEVTITVDTRHRRNGQSVNGQSWIAAGLVNINMDCGESFVYGCEDRFQFDWSNETWELTNGEASVTRSYDIVGRNNDSLNVAVTIENDGSLLDQNNCGTELQYTSTCNADFAASACGADYRDFECSVISLAMRPTTHTNKTVFNYSLDKPALISKLRIRDIDFRSDSDNGNTWQDVVTVKADLNGVAVPVAVVTEGSSVNVFGNNTTDLEVAAAYVNATNGNQIGTSEHGHVEIQTGGLVNNITITLKNGSSDTDGESNLSVVYISGFEACAGEPNQIPVVNDDEFEVVIDATLTANLFTDNGEGKDFLGDEPITSISVVNNVTSGSLSVNNDGLFTYIPNANNIMGDVFTYVVADADGDKDTAVAIITITSLDADNDRLGDVLDIDDDNDGILDIYETCGSLTPGVTTIKVMITTDDKPSETEWKLQGPRGQLMKIKGYSEKRTTYTYEFETFHSGHFKFEIKDAKKNGMTDGFDGGFKVYVNSIMKLSGSDFGKEFKERFWVDDNMFGCLPSNPSSDDDWDGIVNFRDADYCELNAAGVCDALDFDGDGVPNFLDLDSDNDLIPDNVEGQATQIYDLPLSADVDEDGIDNAYDADNNGVRSSGNGSTGLAPVNTDGTDLPDYLDLDSDNDGLTDEEESGNVRTGEDANGNGMDDGAEEAVASSERSGSNGYSDPNGSINDPKQMPDEDDNVEYGGDVDFREFASSVLPVELAYFTVEAQQNNAVLLWSTYAEINNDFFEVQTSMDAINWTVIEVVEGAGNSNVQVDYTTTDENLAKGVHYYRLKQVDFDGTSEFSNVQSVEITVEGTALNKQYEVFPTLATSSTQINIVSTDNNNASVRMISLNGQTIFAADAVNKIDLSALSVEAGTYVIEINNGINTQIERVVIQ